MMEKIIEVFKVLGIILTPIVAFLAISKNVKKTGVLKSILILFTVLLPIIFIKEIIIAIDGFYTLSFSETIIIVIASIIPISFILFRLAMETTFYDLKDFFAVNKGFFLRVLFL